MAPKLTRRQKIQEFLNKSADYVSIAQIYDHLKARKPVEKTAIRGILCTGLGKQFVRHPLYMGLYKLKRD
jgi:hypothetical protein